MYFILFLHADSKVILYKVCQFKAHVDIILFFFEIP
jgi:hypothetical protein